MSLRKKTVPPQTPFCGKRGAVGEKHILGWYFRRTGMSEYRLMDEFQAEHKKRSFA